MFKLLRSNYTRLFRMKSLYFAIAFMIFYPAMSCISDYSEMLEVGYPRYFEEAFWAFGTLLAFIMPVLVHLFIGPDYADKTIRNKLVIGHTKRQIYFANLITMMTVTLLLFVIWNITYCLIGLPLLSRSGSVSFDIIISLEELMACFLLTALLVLIAMFMTNKVSAGITMMLVALGLLATGVMLKTTLAQEEYISAMTVTVSVDMQQSFDTDQMIPNPKYVPEGQQKETIRYMERMNVGAQLLDVTDNHEISPVWFFVFDSIMIIVICAGGAALYKRKDLF